MISLLYLLAAIVGVGGDLNKLIGAAQSLRFAGGPQQFSRRLAATLGDVVRLRSPVLAVDIPDPVGGHTDTRAPRARHLILTPPKPVIGRIHFRPALSPLLDQVLQRQPMGSVI